MLTVKDFINKFDSYSNSELLDIESNLDGYSYEAQEALYTIIKKRGGVELLKQSAASDRSLAMEEQRIILETTFSFRQDIDVDSVKSTINSKMLDQSEVAAIVDNTYLKLNAEKEEKSISAKTVALVLLSGVIASLVGGVVMGYFTKNGKVLYMLIAAVFFINFGIIALISKKSLRNPAVLIASIISTVISSYLSGWFYIMFSKE